MTDKRYSMPETRHGLPAFECLSAMQKSIRRSMEREAMEFACELIHTSKAYCTMVCNRLEIISHEDIDTAASPHIVPFVRTACEQARAWYDPEKPDESRMAIGNAIRMMCRAPKSREGDHFQAAVGGRSLLEGYCPTVPDWALDRHTAKGKRMGRGFDHFLAEGTKLVPAPETKDAYQDEAHRLWLLDDERSRQKPRDLGAAAVVADAEPRSRAAARSQPQTDG
jgi:replication-associated recombination protein RarA